MLDFQVTPGTPLLLYSWDMVESNAVIWSEFTHAQKNDGSDRGYVYMITFVRIGYVLYYWQTRIQTYKPTNKQTTLTDF